MYLVFAGDDYYPTGWGDCQDAVESREEAEQLALHYVAGDSEVQGGSSYDWAEIIDLELLLPGSAPREAVVAYRTRAEERYKREANARAGGLPVT